MQHLHYRYFTVKQLPAEPGDDKPSFNIINTGSGAQIGLIGWYTKWRQWCFSPIDSSIWSAGCLTDVQNAIDKITKKHK